MFLVRLDDEGYIIDYFEGTEEDLSNDVVPVDMTDSDPIFTPKYDRSIKKWVEGETEKERQKREELNLIQSLVPKKEEIQDSEIEIKILTLLTELEVV